MVDINNYFFSTLHDRKTKNLVKTRVYQIERPIYKTNKQKTMFTPSLFYQYVFDPLTNVNRECCSNDYKCKRLYSCFVYEYISKIVIQRFVL